jgi:hypothetical protein
MHTARIATVCLFGLLGGTATAWQPVPGNLTTPWTSRVNPTNPLPEYPRPQMMRADWISLNGLWQFAEAAQAEAPPVGRNLEGEILVPFPVESALSGIGRHIERVWYRRIFQVPAGYQGKRILLHFGAVDWEARVWVNGTQVGTHRGGYDGFTFDVTDALRPSGDQELIVGVWDPMDPGPNPRGKQVRDPQDIWFSPVTGIWQTVWLEPAPVARIVSYKVTPDIDAGVVKLRVQTANAPEGTIAQVNVMKGSAVISWNRGPADQEITVPVPDALHWTPESPHLYDLGISLYSGVSELDEVRGYFGMRKISLKKDSQGIQRLALNNRIVFQIGPLDQGYWPDGLYTAPTDEALKFDIEMTKKFGFNMTRKHVKVEPERWYYWCDKLGLLVWQDMPNGVNSTGEWRTQFEVELARLIEGRYNHPSIITWVVFNEGWGQYDTVRVTNWAMSLDPSRLVNSASGWVDHGAGHMVDMHIYPGPSSPNPEPNRAAVLGEFGGIWAYAPNHVWLRSGYTYAVTQSFSEVTRGYEQMMNQVYTLRDNPGMSAAVYTEITDVETEQAGLMTYDRRIVKGDLNRIAAATKGKPLPSTGYVTILPTSEAGPTQWRFTYSTPPARWMKPEFNDSAWSTRNGAFGTPGGVVRTNWSTYNIWLRRDFFVDRPERLRFFLRLNHDEDVEVYINGRLALSEAGYNRAYDYYPITGNAANGINSGRNVLAIHCRNAGGNQFIDAGIVCRPAVSLTGSGEPLM